MKKQQVKQPVIDLDTFQDVSLYQLIPSGQGFGQAMLKIFVDSVLNGNGKLTSLLITGKEGLATHASAFLRALGIDNYNQIDASMLYNNHDLYIFFCAQIYQGYIITNVENVMPTSQFHLCEILKKQVFSPYNYMAKEIDIHDVPGLVIMTAKDRKKVPKSVIDCIDYVVELEDYSIPEQLELIILQRLKYAHIDYEDECVLQEIVKYGRNNLNQGIQFMRYCVAVMQSEGRNKLLKEDVIRAGRLNRLPFADDAIPL